jgi:hypothetical protein
MFCYSVKDARCTTCDCGSVAQFTAERITPPEKLIISLNRFTENGQKNQQTVLIPTDLTIGNEKYQLKVITAHLGNNRNGGHYVSFVKRSVGTFNDGSELYYLCNDDNTKIIRKTEMLYICERNAYTVLYEKCEVGTPYTNKNKLTVNPSRGNMPRWGLESLEANSDMELCTPPPVYTPPRYTEGKGQNGAHSCSDMELCTPPPANTPPAYTERKDRNAVKHRRGEVENKTGSERHAALHNTNEQDDFQISTKRVGTENFDNDGKPKWKKILQICRGPANIATAPPLTGEPDKHEPSGAPDGATTYHSRPKNDHEYSKKTSYLVERVEQHNKCEHHGQPNGHGDVCRPLNCLDINRDPARRAEKHTFSHPRTSCNPSKDKPNLKNPGSEPQSNKITEGYQQDPPQRKIATRASNKYTPRVCLEPSTNTGKTEIAIEARTCIPTTNFPNRLDVVTLNCCSLLKIGGGSKEAAIELVLKGLIGAGLPIPSILCLQETRWTPTTGEESLNVQLTDGTIKVRMHTAGDTTKPGLGGLAICLIGKICASSVKIVRQTREILALDIEQTVLTPATTIICCHAPATTSTLSPADNMGRYTDFLSQILTTLLAGKKERIISGNLG